MERLPTRGMKFFQSFLAFLMTEITIPRKSLSIMAAYANIHLREFRLHRFTVTPFAWRRLMQNMRKLVNPSH